MALCSLQQDRFNNLWKLFQQKLKSNSLRRTMITSSLERSSNLPSQRRTVSSGFSLIELLVTIAIVSILAALTFTWLKKVRLGAERTGCLTQFRQVGANIHRYLADNQMIFFGQGTPGTDSNWIKQIDPEASPIKNIYKCPGDKSPPRIERTYRFNSTPGNSGPPYPSLLFGRSYYKIVHPSKKILVFCVAYSGPAPMPLFRVDTDAWRDTYDKNKSFDANYPRPHGNDQVSLLFADGHAEVKPYPLDDSSYRYDEK